MSAQEVLLMRREAKNRNKGTGRSGAGLRRFMVLAVVMLLTVFVGEGLRDAFDPRQKSRLE